MISSICISHGHIAYAYVSCDVRADNEYDYGFLPTSLTTRSARLRNFGLTELLPVRSAI